MKVWITKYALTAGLEEIEVRDCGGGMVETAAQSWKQYFHGEGRDWHRTKEGALARCEAMRKAKLKSIDKQRKRIESLRFEAM